MSNEEPQKVKLLLRDYVEKSSSTPDIHWDPKLRNKNLQLAFDPYTESQKEMAAHYFLLVAAIDRPEYVQRSETTRALMIQIHRIMGNDCFKAGQKATFAKIVNELDPFLRFGENKDQIPTVLDATNSYVETNAKEGLVKHSLNFAKPSEMVQDLSKNVPFLRGQYFEHTWMYIRWMTRDYPDFHVFEKFSAKDLQIPLTRYVRFVACCLGFCENLNPAWEHPIRIDDERKQFTEFAASSGMFPEDPTVVDYPFYVLGRWLYGETPSIKLLNRYLEFWQKFYARVKGVPIEFGLSKRETTFEKETREHLERLRFYYEVEQNTFRFPEETGVPHYKPDFVLHKCTKKDKTVILEPHGPWTPREEKTYTLYGKTHTVLANPKIIGEDERKFVEKLRAFRKTYGDQYYLALILPSQVIERIKWDYPDIADEMIEGRDLPKLLYSIRKEKDPERSEVVES